MANSTLNSTVAALLGTAPNTTAALTMTTTRPSTTTPMTTTTGSAYVFVNVFDFAEFDTPEQWVNAILVPLIYLLLIAFTLFSGDLVCRICSHAEVSSKSTSKGISGLSKSRSLVKNLKRVGRSDGDDMIKEDDQMSSSEAAAAQRAARRGSAGRSLAEIKAETEVARRNSQNKDREEQSTSAGSPHGSTAESKPSKKNNKIEAEPSASTNAARPPNDPNPEKQASDLETGTADVENQNASGPETKSNTNDNTNNNNTKDEGDGDDEVLGPNHVETYFLKGFRMEFLEFYRTFEDFVAVLDRDPPIPSQSLRVAYHEKGRKALYSTFAGTAIASATRICFLLMFFAGLWSWLVHTLKVELEGCPYEQEGLDVYVSAGCTPDDFTSNRRIAIFLQHCAAVSEFNKVLEPLVAFLVAFYCINSLQNWNRVYLSMHEIQQKMLTFALFCGTLFDGEKPSHLKSRYRIYRYLNVLHFHCYGDTAEALKTHRKYFSDKLVAVGLLTEPEKEVIEAATYDIASIYELLRKAIDDAEEEPHAMVTKARIYNDFLGMKRAVDEFRGSEEIYPPLSWAQVTQLLLDFYLLSLPIAVVENMFVEGAGPFQPWPMIGCFLVTLFFQGLMSLVDIIRDPFGPDVDDFNPDAVLMRTERELFSALANMDSYSSLKREEDQDAEME